MERYDIAILGTGPAGVSAAITATIRNKKIILIGSADLSLKMVKAHEIQNYPGLPHIKGEDMAAAFKGHLDSMGIEITEDRISSVYAMGDYFVLQGGEMMYEATTVILASGVNTSRSLPGEDDFLGRGVSYCATCDAPLYRGKKTAVVGYNEKEEAEARFLSEVCEEVLYFPMYTVDDAADISERFGARTRLIREKVIGIESGSSMQSKVLRTDAGNTYEVSGVFVLRESVAPDKLIPGIEVRDNHVAVDRQMATSLPGCFAAGDVTGTPYQYIKSAGEGNVAALSAVKYLDELKRINA
ncbi:MAG: NAD(P)/FAD-dependent oxidoreductase [Lachnospiraceae bacterium]|nr:NAD(P)/FAD-dependent oxidoreductase [Lachnospiraceae bacterium]